MVQYSLPYCCPCSSYWSSTAPSSPLNLSVSTVPGSPNQLSASWSPPIPKNGIITAYTVYCNTSASQPYPEQVIGPNGPTVRSVLGGTLLGGMSMFRPPANMSTFNTGLNPYTQYNCYVTANTSFGEGTPSQIMTARTDQSSKQNPDKGLVGMHLSENISCKNYFYLQSFQKRCRWVQMFFILKVHQLYDHVGTLL